MNVIDRIIPDSRTRTSIALVPRRQLVTASSKAQASIFHTNTKKRPLFQAFFHKEVGISYLCSKLREQIQQCKLRAHLFLSAERCAFVARSGNSPRRTRRLNRKLEEHRMILSVSCEVIADVVVETVTQLESSVRPVVEGYAWRVALS